MTLFLSIRLKTKSSGWPKVAREHRGSRRCYSDFGKLWNRNGNLSDFGSVEAFAMTMTKIIV
jgi:hypothetical protein